MQNCPCRAEKLRPFTKFLHLVATTDWSLCPPRRNRAPNDVLVVSGHLELQLAAAVRMRMYLWWELQFKMSADQENVIRRTIPAGEGGDIGSSQLWRRGAGIL